MSENNEIRVPPELIVHLKVMEYDKLISEAEEVVARLKKERSSFIFEQNVQAVKVKYKDPA